MDETDETERQREAAMEIIAKAGAARSCAFAAIHRAKAFDFGGAAEQLMSSGTLCHGGIRCNITEPAREAEVGQQMT